MTTNLQREIKRIIGHLKTITIHKWYVGIECFKQGLYWQGIVHDLSKYTPVELANGFKYWDGKSTPIGKEKADKGYSYAWLNHRAKNKHHWEYWVDFRNGEILLCPIPNKYIKEMACDMIGASRAYGTNDPYGYFKKNNKVYQMSKADIKKLGKYIKQFTGAL